MARHAASRAQAAAPQAAERPETFAMAGDGAGFGERVGAACHATPDRKSGAARTTAAAASGRGGPLGRMAAFVKEGRGRPGATTPAQRCWGGGGGADLGQPKASP